MSSVQCVNVCIAAVTSRETHYHCSVVLEKKGNTRTHLGQFPKMAYVLSPLRVGVGREVVERPLFQTVVYVRSGSGVQTSLGMLGLYRLGIICSSMACTVYNKLMCVLRCLVLGTIKQLISVDC